VTTARREGLEPPGFTHPGRVTSPGVRRSRIGPVWRPARPIWGRAPWRAGAHRVEGNTSWLPSRSLRPATTRASRPAGRCRRRWTRVS